VTVNLGLPVIAGVAIAFPLYAHLAGPDAGHTAFALFVGVAAGTTALPVLAAILDDLGLSATALGRLSLGAAAVTDIGAWSLLALVAASAGHGGASQAALRVGGAACLALVVLGVVRPLFRRVLAAVPAGASGVVQTVVGIGLAIALATATEHIGVSVVLGALLAGAAIGRPPAGQQRLSAGARRVNRALLLPVFFAATGLRIDLGSGWSAGLFAAAACVLLVAATVKITGVTYAATWSGLTRRDAVGLGFLLNTKGLTEIVVLRLGYDLGLLSRPAFGVLVVAALLATAATAPALQLLGLVPRADTPTLPAEQLAASD